MEHPLTPTRITIDFRDEIDPHRGWIVGVGDGRARVELIALQPATDGGAVTTDGRSGESAALGGARALADVPGGASPGADAGADVVLAVLDCTCPDFCERDHANE